MFITPTCPRPSPRQSGFSLLELLLVLTLAPVVFFAVYANFNTGIRLWQRLQVETHEEDLVIFTQKAQRDFENMMRYSSVPFEGGKDKAIFLTGIESEPVLGGRRSIGQVRYFYDDAAKAIFRETKNVNESYQESSGTTNLLLKNVSSFEFAYLTFDKLSGAYVWNDNYRSDKPGNMPIAVRLSFTLAGMDENTQQVFFIPAGGSLT